MEKDGKERRRDKQQGHKNLAQLTINCNFYMAWLKSNGPTFRPLLRSFLVFSALSLIGHALRSPSNCYDLDFLALFAY
jgi:hypothetical protein